MSLTLSCAFATSNDSHEHARVAESLGYSRAWFYDSPALYPRLFEKDYSLVWRSPTHFIRSARENWMGKGALRECVEGGETLLASAEETTNLPLELQAAIDDATRRTRRPRRDGRAVDLVVRPRSPAAGMPATMRHAASPAGGASI